MASDLCCISDMNLLFKYADDTNLLVPENTNHHHHHHLKVCYCPYYSQEHRCMTINVRVGGMWVNVDLVDQFSNIREWADSNGMVINLHKTKEIVLHRPHPRRWSLPKSLEDIEHVKYTLSYARNS